MIEETKTKIEKILNKSQASFDWDFDESDELYDLDFLVSFDETKTLDEIRDCVKTVRDNILDLGNVDVTILQDQLEDAYEIALEEGTSVWIDFYIDIINPNHWIWFNVGQKGDFYVQWQCAVINRNFDARTILFESCEWDENGENPKTVWVTADEFRMMPKSVAPSFIDLEKVARAVRDDFYYGEEQYLGHNNWTYIYALFDMGNLNEYGLGENLWEDE